MFKLEEEDLFSGVLLEEKSGTLLPAGMNVVFSEDKRAYFSQVQIDGLDGLQWDIHRVDGSPFWRGYNYIPYPADNYRRGATLQNPRWMPDGKFSADAECVLSTKGAPSKWIVTLKNIAGKWDWHPQVKCRKPN